MSKLPFAWLLLACASVGCTPQGFGTTSSTTGSYLDQGVAQYGGKPLLGTAGEFLNLAVSPSGKQVAFVGRESNVAYELFVADVGGTARKLVGTGQSPRDLQWSQDEQRLFYRATDVFQPGQPMAAGPTPTGEAIHVVSVADGQDRKIRDVAGRDSEFPSPNLDQVAVFGVTENVMLTVADGKATPLTAGYWEQARAFWNPSGTWMWVYDGKALARLDAPSWQRGKELLATHPGKAVWQPDGKTLKLLAVEPIEGDHLRVETLYEDGTTGDPLSAPLEAPPARYRFAYEAMLPSPDGKRVLLHRTTSPVVIDADAGMFGPAPTPPPDQPPAANLLVDAETGHLEHVAPGVTPLGWLDAGRALVYTGRANAQDKVLSVVTL